MSAIVSFLSQFWSDETDGALFTLGQEKRGQSCASPKDELRTALLWDDDDGIDVYFCPARFKRGSIRGASSRDTVNFVHSNAWYLDVDVKGKGYPDLDAAKQAVEQFCEAYKLPDPQLVLSGGGLHVYWVTDEHVERADWLPVARGLSGLTNKWGLKCDNQVTVDAIRLLRVPGTTNKKLVDDRPVTLLTEVPDSLLDNGDFQATVATAYAEHVGQWPPVVKGDKKKAQQAAEDAFMEQNPAPVAADVPVQVGITERDAPPPPKLAEVAAECAMFRYYVDDPEQADEPIWQTMLSNLMACEGGEATAHEVSAKHPHYEHGWIQEKLNRLEGPHGCNTFQVRGKAEMCEGCDYKPHQTQPVNTPHLKGKIFPIQRAAPLPAELKDQPLREPPARVVEVMPHGYYRDGEKLMRKPRAAATPAETEPVVVCRWPLRVAAMAHDEALVGEGRYRQKFHMMLEGFSKGVLTVCPIPGEDLINRGKLFGHIASAFGLGFNKAEEHEFFTYIRWAMLKGRNENVVKVATSYGWQDDGETFVLGNKAYSEKEVTNVEVANAGAIEPHMLTGMGTLAGWKEIVDDYVNHEDSDHLAYAGLNAWGSILAKLTRTESVPVTFLRSRGGGTGKSMVQAAISSAYGHPGKGEGLTRTNNATQISMTKYLGLANSLPLCMDELALDEREKMGDFVKMVADGHARSRGAINAQTRKLEVEKDASWSLCCTISTNEDILGLLADDGPALTRCLVIDCPPIDRYQGGGTGPFKQLTENYGWAGRIFLDRCMVKGVKVLYEMFATKRRYIAETFKLGLTVDDSGVGRLLDHAALSLTGLDLAREFGLTDMPVDRMEKQARKLIMRQVSFLRDNQLNYLDWLQGWITSNRDHFSAYPSRDLSDNTTGMTHELRYPLFGRMVTDKNEVYISSTLLRKALKDEKLSWEEFSAACLKAKVAAALDNGSRPNVPLLGGVERKSTKTHCYKFKLGYLNELLEGDTDEPDRTDG